MQIYIYIDAYILNYTTYNTRVSCVIYETSRVCLFFQFAGKPTGREAE